MNIAAGDHSIDALSRLFWSTFDRIDASPSLFREYRAPLAEEYQINTVRRRVLETNAYATG